VTEPGSGKCAAYGARRVPIAGVLRNTKRSPSPTFGAPWHAELQNRVVADVRRTAAVADDDTSAILGSHQLLPISSRPRRMRSKSGGDPQIDFNPETAPVGKHWMKKNPFMSIWLSGANAVAGRARVQTTAQARAALTKQVTRFWTGAWLPATKSKRRRSGR
jgi:hypothetical protein